MRLLTANRAGARMSTASRLRLRASIHRLLSSNNNWEGRVRILPLLVFCLLAGCAAKQEAGPAVSVGDHRIHGGGDAAYRPGVSTETQMIAARGQPQNRSV